MELKGERLIPALVDATWAALNDRETLAACAPTGAPPPVQAVRPGSRAGWWLAGAAPLPAAVYHLVFRR